MSIGGIACIFALIGVFGSGQPGISVMPVLRIDQGPRFAAMGGAGIGAVDDASSIYWNPAGLGRVQDKRYAFSHHQWFAGIKDELLHAALPTGSGAVGLGLVYSGESGVEFWDASNMPGDTFRTWDGVLSAGYGFTVARNYHFGAALKGFYQSLYTSAGYGGAADIGFACRPFPFLGLGAVGRNIGVATYGLGLEQMPTEVGVGSSVTFGPVNAVVDVILPMDNGPALHAGVEYLPVPELAVRLGYRTGPQDIGTLGALSGLTAGIGVSLGGLSLDYAITPYGKLGMAHRIGLEAAFPRKGLGSVSVKTVDGTTMLPLAAGIGVSGVISYKGETGRSGEMELTRLPAGDLVISTNRYGYVPRVDTMQILGDREQTAIIALSPLTYGGVTGVVFDAGTRKPIGGNVAYRGPVQGGLGADPELGSYALRNVPAGQYELTASGLTDDYVAQTCTLKVESGRITSRDFYLAKRGRTTGPQSERPEPGKADVRPELPSVGFESGKADIRPEFEPILVKAGEMLVAGPSVTVELAGHADAHETASVQFPSSWELSQARAEAVRQYLTAKFGIAVERLTAHGYGDTQPVAPSDSEENMARNRRVEFRVTGRQ
jgi:outer membrane protein OmpA-like peptidoglycan-associated protein